MWSSPAIGHCQHSQAQEACAILSVLLVIDFTFSSMAPCRDMDVYNRIFIIQQGIVAREAVGMLSY